MNTHFNCIIAMQNVEYQPVKNFTFFRMKKDWKKIAKVV